MTGLSASPWDGPHGSASWLRPPAVLRTLIVGAGQAGQALARDLRDNEQYGLRLVAVLDPEIVLRADGGALAGASRIVRGPQAVAAQASTFSRLGLSNQFVLVNGNIGLVSRRSDGRLFAVLGFTIAGGKIVEIDILADPERLSRLDLSAIES